MAVLGFSLHEKARELTPYYNVQPQFPRRQCVAGFTRTSNPVPVCNDSISPGWSIQCLCIILHRCHGERGLSQKPVPVPVPVRLLEDV